jgi:seryl-tRNA synthetase
MLSHHRLVDFRPRAIAAQFADDTRMECRFVYLRRAAALLELALCNYAMQKVASKGFMPMTTPDLVRESVLVKCGFQPRGENTQVLRCKLRFLAAPIPGYTVLERH